MKCRSVRFVMCSIVLALTPVAAAERPLLKYRQACQFGEETIAEFTKIMTADKQLPDVSKMLYQDEEGRRLVIVMTVTGQWSGTTEIESVQTGSVVRLESSAPDGAHEAMNATLWLGQAPPINITAEDYPPSGPLSAAKRSEIQQAFDQLPAQFRDELQDAAIVGAQHCDNLSLVWATLAILFPDVQRRPVLGTASDFTEVVKAFDAQSTPPGTFEQGFGSEYFQFP